MHTNLLQLSDKHGDPLEELRHAANAVGDAARRVLERAVGVGPLEGMARVLLKPRIRLVEDATTVVVVMEAPGAEHDSLEVTMSSNDILRITGNHVKETNGQGGRNLDSHRGTPSFERTLPLARHKVERSKATARFEKGLLTVTIPKVVKGSSASEADDSAHAV